jgi:hypothetical protein
MMQKQLPRTCQRQIWLLNVKDAWQCACSMCLALTRGGVEPWLTRYDRHIGSDGENPTQEHGHA